MARASSPPAAARAHTGAPRINLLRGWPAPELLPAELLQRAATRVLADAQLYVPGLQYGPDPGDERCRTALARWLGAFYCPEQLPDVARIVITGGASQSLGLLMVALTDPVYTRAVWVAAPTYYLAFGIFEDAGFAAQDGRLRAVSEDAEGIDVAELKRGLELVDAGAAADGRESFKPRHRYAKLYRHVIYVVPSFANPSATSMSRARREALVRVAREHDALIVCDDVYDMLEWPVAAGTTAEATTCRPVGRVVDVDRELEGGTGRSGADGYGNCISNGTFSKLVAPGTRCGWIESTAALALAVSQTGMQRSGGAPSHLTSTYLAELLETGALQQHLVHTLLPEYARRYRVMAAAVQQHLVPLGVQWAHAARDTAGGFFVWLRLPDGVDGTALAQRALNEQNLVVAPGALFEVPHGALHFRQHVRLCFAYEQPARLVAGVQRLAAALEHWRPGGTSTRDTTDSSSDA